mgnify:CR=1 FL=1
MADAENIARPYADAIFSVARDNGALKEWEQRLKAGYRWLARFIDTRVQAHAV